MDISIILSLIIIIAVFLWWVFIPRRDNSVPAKNQRTELDQRAKLDAQRFAKLLVAEIRLHNPDKLAIGRENCDIYDRLKKEIERAQHIYEKRVGKDNAELMGYFHEELVSTLADGDPGKLGLNYSKGL
jgi:hypothetical protein